MTYPTVWRPVPAGEDLPAEVYETRAAVDGVDWAAATLADVGTPTAVDPAHTFFPDVSQFQPPIDATFQSSIFSFRVCDGTYFDLNAAANWQTASRMLADPNHPLQLVWFYVFYRPGTWGAVNSYISKVFGTFGKLPDRVAAMIDCEGWGGQVTGNHSAELNQWADQLAARTASGQASVVGYSYTSAFQELWPQMSPWIKRQTASYGTWDPGWYGWQYSGGTGVGGQPGWPHGAAPWPLCDMNVIQRPIGQIVTDFGFTEDAMPLDAADLDAIRRVVRSEVVTADIVGLNHIHDLIINGNNTTQAAVAAVPTVAEIAAAVVAALPPSPSGGPSLDDINKAIRDALNATKLATL